MLRSIVVAIRNKFRKKEIGTIEKLRNRGVKVGENVDILNTFIDGCHGRLVSIGNNVTITGARILTHDASTKKCLGYSKIGFVTIGDNVFIGNGAIILPGTSIGNNVIIGAGAVVASNVEDNSVMAGNPAKKICAYDEYMHRNKERIESNESYVSNKPFWERNEDEWDELVSGLSSKKYGFDI